MAYVTSIVLLSISILAIYLFSNPKPETELAPSTISSPTYQSDISSSTRIVISPG
jgi:hypothetical protein